MGNGERGKGRESGSVPLYFSGPIPHSLPLGVRLEISWLVADNKALQATQRTRCPQSTRFKKTPKSSRSLTRKSTLPSIPKNKRSLLSITPSLGSAKRLTRSPLLVLRIFRSIATPKRAKTQH